MSANQNLRYSDVCKSGTGSRTKRNGTRQSSKAKKNSWCQLEPSSETWVVSTGQNVLSAETGWGNDNSFAHLPVDSATNDWNLQPDPNIWLNPLPEEPPKTLEELKDKDNRFHVDLVGDMIPYWRQGVEDAKNGIEWKLWAFLEELMGRRARAEWWQSSYPQMPRSRKSSSRWSQQKGWGNAEVNIGWGDWTKEDGHNGWGPSAANTTERESPRKEQVPGQRHGQDMSSPAAGAPATHRNKSSRPCRRGKGRDHDEH